MTSAISSYRRPVLRARPSWPPNRGSSPVGQVPAHAQVNDLPVESATPVDGSRSMGCSSEALAELLDTKPLPKTHQNRPSPGSPRHKPGTPNLSWSHSWHKGLGLRWSLRCSPIQLTKRQRWKGDYSDSERACGRSFLCHRIQHPLVTPTRP